MQDEDGVKTAAKTATGGEYLVLRQVQASDAESAAYAAWVEVVGAEKINEVVLKYGEGVYVRVPKRSWHPVKATVEQVTRVKLG